uniref:Protein Asterix n=1 Tax=Rhabditophanes sp. KR3021 TaxID=114890 RepID=A0AC35U4S2_9BILA
MQKKIEKKAASLSEKNGYKLNRYNPNTVQSPIEDPISEYMHLVGMIFSISGLMFRIKWCSWIALFSAVVCFTNAKTTEDVRQIISSFMLAISSIVMCYVQVPTPMQIPFFST